jgi:hypothetical protein
MSLLNLIKLVLAAVCARLVACLVGFRIILMSRRRVFSLPGSSTVLSCKEWFAIAHVGSFARINSL